MDLESLNGEKGGNGEASTDRNYMVGAKRMQVLVRKSVMSCKMREFLSTRQSDTLEDYPFALRHCR